MILMDRALFLMGISMSALPPPLFALSLIMEPVHQPMSAAVTATSSAEGSSEQGLRLWRLGM